MQGRDNVFYLKLAEFASLARLYFDTRWDSNHSAKDKERYDFLQDLFTDPAVNWIYMLISNRLNHSAHIQNRTQNLKNSIKDTKMKVNKFLSISDGLHSQFLQERLTSTHLQKEQTYILFYDLSVSDHG